VRLALKAGFPGRSIFLYGNGKQDWELSLAIQAKLFNPFNPKLQNADEVICKM
jgi:diaminopimelate decarboxylase